jgi:hypothetical protein
VLLQSLSTVSALYPYIEFYAGNDCQDDLTLDNTSMTLMPNQSLSGCVPMGSYIAVNASAVMVFTNEKCLLGMYADPKCDDAIAIQADGETSYTFLPPVRLQAPITVRDLSSEVRRDWIQLIGRKPAHTTAGKGRARRMPQEKGIPPKTRT